MWNVTWLGDGSYRLTPQSHLQFALDVYQENTTLGVVKVSHWYSENNQRWILSPVATNTFRVAPRTVWWRALTVDGIPNVFIRDYINSIDQHWILIKI
ncbi:unnamed protein product [Rotaria sp. Silwood1]|nr:unnamed protein product [Rotaria sp. Silwood1]CAF1042488.1 unnamed protein product [Rotaria sp. Silwood1]CAF1338630.1 unnamed protein product [Rotaria sp. Silwood1]CAF1340557.1 unnamed protein product [Rotaria sp. Silwood1]CAF3542325.1 unnamed protein product [Rotaria sp. Silwood1]